MFWGKSVLADISKPFHGETGLNPATTYYWKVIADDGHAGLAQVMAEDSLLKLMSDDG